LQDLLEQEVTEWFGRHKSERKINPSEQLGYRNGYGKTRRFVSKILPLFKRQSEEVRQLTPQLYLHGLASGDFELALRGLLREGAPLSASSLQRLKEMENTSSGRAHRSRRRIGCIFGPMGSMSSGARQRGRRRLLVVIGVKKDGQKRFLALEPGYRESKESWALVLRQLKSRGVRSASLFVGDGNLGLRAAVGEIYPQAQKQLCWNHKMLNVMDRVSNKEQVQANSPLNAMMYAESRQEALKERKKFEQAFRHNPKAFKTVWRTGGADDLL